MRKIMLVVLILSACLFANAQSSQEEPAVNTSETTLVISEDEGYKEVQLQDLNEKVQATIKNYNETFSVKAITHNADKKLTKLTLISKTDESVKEVLLDDEGKEVKI